MNKDLAVCGIVFIGVFLYTDSLHKALIGLLIALGVVLIKD